MRPVIALKVEPGSSASAIRVCIGLDLADGRIEHIQTNPQWKVSNAEQANGEKPEFDATSWKPATAGDGPPLAGRLNAGQRMHWPADVPQRIPIAHTNNLAGTKDRADHGDIPGLRNKTRAFFICGELAFRDASHQPRFKVSQV